MIGMSVVIFIIHTKDVLSFCDILTFVFISVCLSVLN